MTSRLLWYWCLNSRAVELRINQRSKPCSGTFVVGFRALGCSVQQVQKEIGIDLGVLRCTKHFLGIQITISRIIEPFNSRLNVLSCLKQWWPKNCALPFWQKPPAGSRQAWKKNSKIKVHLSKAVMQMMSRPSWVKRGQLLGRLKMAWASGGVSTRSPSPACRLRALKSPPAHLQQGIPVQV